jgi:hypothetical protein
MSKSIPGKRSPCPYVGKTDEACENTMLELSLVDMVDTNSDEKSTMRITDTSSSHTNSTPAVASYFIRPTLSNSAVAKSPSKVLCDTLPAISNTLAD